MAPSLEAANRAYYTTVMDMRTESGPRIDKFPFGANAILALLGPMTHPGKIRPQAPTIGLILVSLLLAACGSSESPPVARDMQEQAREFSAEDKAAALALSLGNVQALSAENSAYARSVSCSIALESVSSQLSEGGQLDTAMIDAIEQVRTVYDNRVQQLGSAEGKAAADIATDRQQRSEEIPESSERGQIAIGCLRAMT